VHHVCQEIVFKTSVFKTVFKTLSVRAPRLPADCFMTLENILVFTSCYRLAAPTLA